MASVRGTGHGTAFCFCLQLRIRRRIIRRSTMRTRVHEFIVVSSVRTKHGSEKVGHRRGVESWSPLGRGFFSLARRTWLQHSREHAMHGDNQLVGGEHAKHWFIK